MEARLNELLQDEAFVAKMQAAENLDTIAGLLNAEGIDITVDELEKQVEMEAIADGELSEDALDCVSGGLSIRTLINILKPILPKPMPLMPKSSFK